MLQVRKKSKGKKDKSQEDEEEEVAALRKEIEIEKKGKGEIEVVTNELERCLAEMERNVYELESGNYDFDDSEIKQRYDNQRQLNVQLQEQKHWLEHELEEIKLKIQNDRSSFLPDPFMMDWDNLSETELKRLVVQYEKTKNDVLLDLKDAQLHLDHEGKEFHHFDHFCRDYRVEILNLNRSLEYLVRSGHLPSNYNITSFSAIGTSSYNGSFPSTGIQSPIPFNTSPKKTPSSPRKSAPLSPRKSQGHPKSSAGSRSLESKSAKQSSPKKKPKTPKNFEDPQNDLRVTKRLIDPKLGPARKTVGVRNLPKIERKLTEENLMRGKQLRKSSSLDSDSDDPDLESLSNFLSGPSMRTPMSSSRRSASNMLDLSELDPVEEMPSEHLEDSP